MQTAVRSEKMPAALALRSTVVATVIEHGAVLLDLDSKLFFTLNETAWTLVQMFEASPASPDAVAGAARRFGATDEQTTAFLRALVDYGLVEESEESVEITPPVFSGAWTAPTIERHSDPLQTIVTSAFDPSIPLAE